jgi:competence transcription factor ComK
MALFVGCKTQDGDEVNVNLEHVRAVVQLKAGVTRITFVNGDTLEVATPVETLVSIGSQK